MFILPGTRSDVTLLPRAEGTPGSEGGDAAGMGSDRRARCDSERLGEFSLPAAPERPRWMRCPGTGTPPPFPPRLSNSLPTVILGMAGLGQLGKLRHTRGVRVPPYPVSAALTRNNLSQPACIQDMLSGSSSQLELPELLGTNPRDSGQQLGRENYSKIIPK